MQLVLLLEGEKRRTPLVSILRELKNSTASAGVDGASAMNESCLLLPSPGLLFPRQPGGFRVAMQESEAPLTSSFLAPPPPPQRGGGVTNPGTVAAVFAVLMSRLTTDDCRETIGSQNPFHSRFRIRARIRASHLGWILKP